jgi:hypothetical protein
MATLPPGPPPTTVQAQNTPAQTTVVSAQEEAAGLQVVMPKVGGIEANIAWTGGETKAGWAGSNNTVPESPYCYRPAYEKDTKSYQKRTSGMNEKFGRDCKKYSVQCFADDVERHLQEHGMDSVFYVEDEDNNWKSLLHHHSTFTTSEIEEKIEDYTNDGTYDNYDLANLKWSATLLVNSIDPEMRKEIIPYCRRGITGPELWMRIIADVHSDSVQRMESLKEEVKAMKLRDFKGENVKMFTAAMLDKCRELENANALPPNICITINNQLTLCTVADFRIEFQGLRKALNANLRLYNGKNQQAIKRLAVDNDHHTYDGILSEASMSYQSLIEQGLWGPAVVNKDKGRAPEAYLTQAEANNLIQKAISNKGSSTGNNGQTTTNMKDVKCFKCGKTGHRRSDCPKKDGDKNIKSKKKASWKSRPPKNGEPETKTVDSMEWHWCAKCSCKMFLQNVPFGVLVMEQPHTRTTIFHQIKAEEKQITLKLKQKWA